MELLSAKELYEVSRIKQVEGKEHIVDALWRAARNGAVELFTHSLQEQMRKDLLDKGYDIQTGNFAVGQDTYEIRISWVKR